MRAGQQRTCREIFTALTRIAQGGEASSDPQFRITGQGRQPVGGPPRSKRSNLRAHGTGSADACVEPPELDDETPQRVRGAPCRSGVHRILHSTYRAGDASWDGNAAEAAHPVIRLTQEPFLRVAPPHNGRE